MNHTSYCESGPSTIQLDIAGSTITVTGGSISSFPIGTTGTITNPGGLALSGTDGDGSFSAAAPGIVLEAGRETAGIYVSGGPANQVVWPGPSSYDALYALSYDKTLLAVGFLTTICNPGDIFSGLPSRKFAIWAKQ